MIPAEFLCEMHKTIANHRFVGLLWHEIDKIRRTGCTCELESIWLWYDLIGFKYDE